VLYSLGAAFVVSNSLSRLTLPLAHRLTSHHAALPGAARTTRRHALRHHRATIARNEIRRLAAALLGTALIMPVRMTSIYVAGTRVHIDAGTTYIFSTRNLAQRS